MKGDFLVEHSFMGFLLLLFLVFFFTFCDCHMS